jgi:hypothetical protein
MKNYNYLTKETEEESVSIEGRLTDKAKQALNYINEKDLPHLDSTPSSHLISDYVKEKHLNLTNDNTDELSEPSPSKYLEKRYLPKHHSKLKRLLRPSSPYVTANGKEMPLKLLVLN